MDILYRVEYESLVDRNLKESFQKYKREHQDNLSFKHYLKKLGPGIRFHGIELYGYSLIFDSESQRSLFLLKWG